MVLNKLSQSIKNFMNRKSVMKSWLFFYIALMVGLLLLVLWGANIFYNAIADSIITQKTEEVNAFSGKMDTLTEECRLYALNLTTDDRFKENFLKVPKTVDEHYELRSIATSLRREMNFVDEFFVYIKSENTIINSLGNLSSPERYYDIFYKNSGMDYDTWMNQFLNSEYSGYYVFDNNAEKPIERLAKVCYVFPINRLHKKDITIVAEIDSSRYESELAKLGADSKMSILIYDESGNSYFSMGENIPQNEQLKDGKAAEGFYETKINGEKVVMYIESSAFAAWNYAFVMPYSIFWFDLIQIKYIGFAIFFVIAIMGIVGIYLITKYNYKAVANIVKRIETNFSTNSNKDENEYVRINKMIDMASQYSIKVENQQKKERTNEVRNLLLGVADLGSKNNGIQFLSDTFITAAFFAPDYEELFRGESMTGKEKDHAIKLIMTNIFSELMEPYGSVDAADIDNINFLLSIDEKYAENAKNIVIQKAEEMREFILYHFEIDIICGVSSKVKGVSNICISYREALSALNNISQNSESRVAVYTKKSVLSKNYYYPMDQMQYLMMLLGKGDRENAFRQIGIIFEINSAVFQVANLAKAMITDIAATIMKAALNVGYKIDAEKLMGSVQSSSRIVAEKIFKSYVNDICEFVKNTHTGREKTLVEKIDAIIAENYTDVEFNVNKIADMLDMTANSLSVAYRRKTEKNILENIQQYRVNEAKRLLEEGDESVEVIAKKSGFASNTTFRRVFKKATGVSASIYREMKKKEKEEV